MLVAADKRIFVEKLAKGLVGSGLVSLKSDLS